MLISGTITLPFARLSVVSSFELLLFLVESALISQNSRLLRSAELPPQLAACSRNDEKGLVPKALYEFTHEPLIA